MDAITSKRYPSELTTFDINYAQEHLEETTEKRKQRLKQIREYFTNNQDEQQIKITTEDDFLLAFLRSCKFDLDRTIDKVKNYYRMRADMPSVFSGRDPRAERLQEILRLGCFVPLRKLQNGRLTVIIRINAFDPKQYGIEEILKISYMILDICTKICPSLQLHGVCAIFDLNGISLAHVKQTTPTIIKHMVQSWQNYHCRPKQLEVINAPTFVNILINVVRSFMTKTMKKRLRVHSGGVEDLYNILDRSVLPLEYGGDDGVICEHVDYWVAEITRQAEWFLFDEQFKICNDS